MNLNLGVWGFIHSYSSSIQDSFGEELQDAVLCLLYRLPLAHCRRCYNITFILRIAHVKSEAGVSPLLGNLNGLFTKLTHEAFESN
jgi:hypothetical protein